MQPPALPGYEPVRLLGSGGYSDVFLYDQVMPRRQVAIKVLVTHGLGDAGRQQFNDEANAMAAVSTHPYIVTVFEAQVSSGGHPYLVMEFYPRPNFSVRARREKIPVAEVLRTGIRVASAVETAHRAGILHRDIKPPNILTSAYNLPGLTDFGIATSFTEGVEAQGMSIPWSPPEILNSSAVGN
jgi:serine/threonine protein kinase